MWQISFPSSNPGLRHHKESETKQGGYIIQNLRKMNLALLSHLLTWHSRLHKYTYIYITCYQKFLLTNYNNYLFVISLVRPEA